MERKLISYSVVPSELYVERTADRQIRKIIDGMGRPGYILVARQMGKTNLLLHTKDSLQNDKVIFSYIDCSPISGLSETECFNFIIDETIETHYHIFDKAEREIEQIRNKANYSGYKMFTRELRILLKYVEKLVFMLDEIDALTRVDFSDKVFSTIRSHYFSTSNHPELKKVTYILSGVIDPKHIIKDPNISPFNIGENIYMNDFSRTEFDSFIDKIGFNERYDDSLINRIYYWTKGNPRLTWDICLLMEDNTIKNIEELDREISKAYFVSYNKAPIDSIRENVKNDTELRDALILLYYNKGGSLSDDTKSRLYLAGIIDFDAADPHFKNPILEKSLSYEWLMSLQTQDVNYLSIADKSIHIEKDYKKALLHLNKFLEDNPTDTEAIDRAKYLMGEAYLRSYNTEQSLKCLQPLTAKKHNTKYYFRALLLEGYSYSNNSDYEKALSCYQKIIEEADIKESIYYKAQIGKVDVLTTTGSVKDLNEAEMILLHLLEIIKREETELNLMSTCFFYLACIEEERKNYPKAIGHLDSAIKTAQRNEVQILLYKKLIDVKDEDKSEVADELYKSLDNIKTKPEAEVLENPLGFNLLYACQVLAELILNYPEYDVKKYLRLFLYDSKENAIIYIYNILEENHDEKSDDFFNYILGLLSNIEWTFDNDQLAIIAHVQLVTYEKTEIAIDYLRRIENDTIGDISEKGGELLINLAHFYLLKQSFKECKHICDLFENNISDIRGLTEGKKILIEYYYACSLYMQNSLLQFRPYGAELLDKVRIYKTKYHNLKSEKLSEEDISVIIKNLNKWEKEAYNRLRSIGAINNNTGKIGRNDIVKVQYISDGHISETKYKKIVHDIEMGLCEIISNIQD